MYLSTITRSIFDCLIMIQPNITSESISVEWIHRIYSNHLEVFLVAILPIMQQLSPTLDLFRRLLHLSLSSLFMGRFVSLLFTLLLLTKALKQLKMKIHKILFSSDGKVVTIIHIILLQIMSGLEARLSELISLLMKPLKEEMIDP